MFCLHCKVSSHHIDASQLNKHTNTDTMWYGNSFYFKTVFQCLQAVGAFSDAHDPNSCI